MAEISQAIIVGLETSMSQLTSAVSSIASSVSNLMLGKADKADLDAKANSASPTFTGGMKIAGLPTSAAGLVAGQLWVDTAAGNVIKVVQEG